MQRVFPLTVLLRLPGAGAAAARRFQHCSVSGFPLPCLRSCIPYAGACAVQEPLGPPKFFNTSLPACRSLRTPADRPLLAYAEGLVLPSGALKPSASATSAFSKLCQHFRVRGHPYGLQDTLSTLRPSCSPCPHGSAMDARLATGGGLALTRQGLSPCKRCQAFLGARTLALTCCRKPQRGTSVGWRQSGAVLGWAASRNAGVFSALGRHLAGEGLGHDLAVPHDERVRADLVHVVGSLRGPQNVCIVALDGLLLHAECGARFAKLRKQRLEQRPNRVGSPERSVRREQDGTRRIVREDAHEVALTKTL